MKPSLLIIIGAMACISHQAFCQDRTEEKPVQGDEFASQRDKAYMPMAIAIITAMGDRHKLALIKPEKEGTDRSLYDLEQWLKKKLEQQTIEVVAPDDVLKCGGVEFQITPHGIGHVAEQCSCPAALYIQWKKQDSKTELNLLMAGSKGETLLQISLDIANPPPPMEPPEPIGITTTESSIPDDGESAIDQNAISDQLPPEEIFNQRKLSISGEGDLWVVVQNDKPIGELDLAKLGSRQDLVEQLQTEISHLDTLRTTAIIITIGGFVAVGLSLPMMNAEGDTKLAGEITTGVGAAIGIAGGVMWWLWGDEATRAGGPDPVHHLLSHEQAQELVENFNSSLRKELQLDSGSKAKRINWYVNPGLGGVMSVGVSLRF